MTTLKELAEKRAHLKRKIELVQDLLSLGYSPESGLKAQFGEQLHDEVMNELDEKWLSPLNQELEELDGLEIDDGRADPGTAGAGEKPAAKKRPKAKPKAKGKG